jgi:hypothetical protein
MLMPVINKAEKGNLPNLIIIGAAKCGTTSLHYYLGLHPQISMSREKELNFFAQELSWDKGIEWYKSNFTGQAVIHGETSPSYTAYPSYKGVAERMYSVVPEAKLIYILRDPIERIISGYVQRYSDGYENRRIEDILKDLDITNRYLSRSMYYLQLSQYLNYFPRSNILIVTMEDLYHQRQLILQKIFKFLNVDDTFYSQKLLKIKHSSIVKRRKNSIGIFLKQLSETGIAKKFSVDLRRNIGRILYLPFSTRIERPVLNDELKEKLIDYLKDDIDRLRQYTGHDFKDWCV